MSQTTPITVAYGDGIGPEIMEATLKILSEAKAAIAVETIEVGKKLYEQGFSTGIAPSAWESINRTKVLLKAPITTPQGGGYKSLNVTMRKKLGLYANVRPCVSYHPFVKTNHPKLDMVIVRENEEDLYAGIEYRLTQDVCESLKLISRPASERICRYAFDYAVKNGRKKVTCFIKDNIMKISDGLFHNAFKEVAKEYPDIQPESYIVDIGSARIAAKPEIFDVIVTENLYGDIISDIAAEISGSVGLAGSANIGAGCAMFEAIHGSAPDISGKGIANPSGLLSAAVMMLVHIGQPKTASLIQNAWLKTLEDGMHTADIYNGENSKKRVTTQEFADEVMKRLGEKPSKFKPAEFGEAKNVARSAGAAPADQKKELVGVDVFISSRETAAAIAEKAGKTGGALKLQSISTRGLTVWPAEGEIPNILYVDLWCLRFTEKDKKTVPHSEVAGLLAKLGEAGIDFVKTQNLYNYDGKGGYSLGQGE